PAAAAERRSRFGRASALRSRARDVCGSESRIRRAAPERIAPRRRPGNQHQLEAAVRDELSRRARCDRRDIQTRSLRSLRAPRPISMRPDPSPGRTVRVYLDYLQSRVYCRPSRYRMGKPNDLVQGTLDLLILKILSLEPRHGWAIAKRIQQVSN